MHGDDNQPPDPYFSAAAFHSLDGRVSTMEGLMAENADATKRNTDSIERLERNTATAVEFIQSLEGGFKVLNGLGKLAKPIGYIAGAIVSGLALWSAIKGFWK